MSSRKYFKERLDEELGAIEFTKERKANVFAEIEKPKNRFLRFLNKEIEVPIVPVLAAAVIAVTGITYTCAGLVRYTEAEIQESRITVIENINGSEVVR